MVFPGEIQFLMRGINACALLLSSPPETMYIFFESLSVSTNSHTLLSCHLPASFVFPFNKKGFVYFHDSTITTDWLLVVKSIQRDFGIEAPPIYTGVQTT